LHLPARPAERDWIIFGFAGVLEIDALAPQFSRGTARLPDR
jgi:hypothetical protein